MYNYKRSVIYENKKDREKLAESSTESFLKENEGKFIEYDGHTVYVPKQMGNVVIIPKEWWDDLD